MKPLRFHRAAREDLKVAARRYAAIHPELGGQFYDAIDSYCRRFGGNPDCLECLIRPCADILGHGFHMPWCIWICRTGCGVWR